mmetsp:Transcript_4976/g.10014  ORF Transcript_4976/g.10014 Transcript_4976/m.10014 type:complete len:82 (-) Transcript_4976:859-1104(-)
MEGETCNSMADLGAGEERCRILEHTDEVENTQNLSVFTFQTFHSVMNTPSHPIDQSDCIMEGKSHNSVADLGAGEERCRIF